MDPNVDTAEDFVRAKSAQRRLQNFVFQEQQKRIINTAVQRLSDVCIHVCVDRGEEWTSTQQRCLSHCTQRYFEVSMYVLKKCAAKDLETKPFEF